jgi:solute carrier family 13 (sodium-dependent dicarboxylate transporter), member 2/3/5
LQAPIITIIIIATAVILFIIGRIPLAITGMGVIAALIMTKILTVSEAFEGFSNPVTLLILFMAPIGEALIKTGVGRLFGDKIIKMAGGNEKKLIFAIMMVSLVMSAFTTNTGTVLALLPIVISVAAAFKIPREKLLIPLAFSSAFGGVLTLIGASPNILINSFAFTNDVRPFGFFEFGKAGIFIAVFCIIYMQFIGTRQLGRMSKKFVREDFANQDVNYVKPSKYKMYASVIIMFITVICMVFINSIQPLTGLSLTSIAMIGAMLTVLTGCLNMKQFFESVSWEAVILFAALIVVGTAMTKTGAAELVAHSVLAVIPSDNPYVILAVLFFIGGILAQFMSHTAATAILAPIYLLIANNSGMNPQTVLMALCLSTGMAVATPIGTPPNVIVYNKANYKFMDFVKTGMPVFVISWVISVVILPVFFPF